MSNENPGTATKVKPVKINTKAKKTMDPALAAEIAALESSIKNPETPDTPPAGDAPPASPEVTPVADPVPEASRAGVDAIFLRADTDGDTPTPAALGIFSANCLQCTAFLSDDLAEAVDATDSYIKKCHYEHGTSSSGKRGNPNCPAAYVRLVRGVNIEDLSTKLAEAWLANDVERIAEVTNSLQSRDPIVSARVMREAKVKMHQMETNGS